MANVVTRVARRAAAPPATAARRRPRAVLPRARRNTAAWGFLIGAVLCFSFFSWYPIVREFIMSFQKPVYGGGYAFAGWSNYLRIFRDPTFWQAWRNTLEFTVLALVLGFALPFVVAIVLNELRHARGYLRALVYLPVMLTAQSPRRCCCSPTSTTRSTGCSTTSCASCTCRRRSGCSSRAPGSSAPRWCRW